jgi:uncharacterized membrane protein
VGFYSDSSFKVHGFLLRNGTFTTIDAPGATDSRASGINPQGDIVGFYSDNSGQHGFLLTPCGQHHTDAEGCEDDR